MKKAFNILVLISMTVVLSACGFHLRGQSLIPPQLKVLFLQSSEPYGKFTLLLKNQLHAMGVVFENNPKNAPYTLNIIKASLTQTITSISENTLIRTYVVTASVTYNIEDNKNRIVIPETSLTGISTYTTNDNQLNGDMQVFKQEGNELYRDIIFRMLTRLHSRQAQSAFAHHIQSSNYHEN